MAAGAVGNAQFAGITVAQYDVDDGSCLTGLPTGEAIAVDDIPADARWPAFARRGRRIGGGSSFSVPLRINGGAVGALNLYSREARGLDAQAGLRAWQFADQAAGAVALDDEAIRPPR